MDNVTPIRPELPERVIAASTLAHDKAHDLRNAICILELVHTQLNGISGDEDSVDLAALSSSLAGAVRAVIWTAAEVHENLERMEKAGG